jgi:hypothetical protein
MHDEVITTTSKFVNQNTIVNSTNLHQSSQGDGRINVSILHPHQHINEIGELVTSNTLNAPGSTDENQIISSQTKIILSTNDVQTIKDDISPVIINNITSNNDHNLLILPANETCDNDKNSLALGQLSSSQTGQIDIDLNDVSSLNDETSSREGEHKMNIYIFRYSTELCY